ncbi:MAG TPA: hypothetical protein DEO88_02280 [Syntrophobacteraceae bacterium]|nr:hypothetical protein [Syntrophobacteraceae bacterium]
MRKMSGRWARKGSAYVFDLYAPFIVGLLGSVHCLGMCGPLVVAYALCRKSTDTGEKPGWRSWYRRGIAHHIAFHSGRLVAYSLLGTMTAALTGAAGIGRFFLNANGIIKVGGGVVLVLLGLMVLRVLPFPTWLTSVSLAPKSFWGRRLPPLLQSQRFAPRIFLGMATGLLPCSLSWAMLVTAAATQEPVRGGLTMLLFGLGTVPLLLLTGLSAHLLSIRIRFLGERLAAVTVMIMGVVLVVQGIGGHGCCGCG